MCLWREQVALQMLQGTVINGEAYIVNMYFKNKQLYDTLSYGKCKKQFCIMQKSAKKSKKKEGQNL